VGACHLRVSLIDLHKRFGRTTAVDGFNLSVRSGEFVSLLGPSGSGKTTILNMLAGFLVPDGGKILIGDRDATRMPPAERNIGVVFQQYALFSHMSVADNVAYGLRRRGWKKDAIGTRTAEMLQLVGLPDHGARRPSQLSGGQQQRVALARALAFSPSLLLMDEPLAALDPETRAQMRTQIRRVHRELAPTVIYVTHDRDEAFALSDRIVIMRDGAIMRCGTPMEIYDNPQSEFVARFYCGFQTLEARVLPREPASDRLQLAWLACHGSLACAAAADQPTVTLAVPPDAIKLADRGTKAVIVDRVMMGGNAVMRCQPEGQPDCVTVEVPGAAARSAEIGSTVTLELQWNRALVVTAENARPVSSNSPT
jgi:ABC-type Fe3+/spermidine/putrescine transport system ATPase subunit